MQITQLKTIITDLLRHQKGVAAVLLYGSYAKGTQQENSDIDIAILYQHESIPSPLELWDLKTQLDKALPAEVDLICLNQADPIIGNQIYQYHQPVFINDPAKLLEYFTLMCSEYMELKEFIRPMEQQILERKYHA